MQETLFGGLINRLFGLNSRQSPPGARRVVLPEGFLDSFLRLRPRDIQQQPNHCNWRGDVWSKDEGSENGNFGPRMDNVVRRGLNGCALRSWHP